MADEEGGGGDKEAAQESTMEKENNTERTKIHLKYEFKNTKYSAIPLIFAKQSHILSINYFKAKWFCEFARDFIPLYSIPLRVLKSP